VTDALGNATSYAYDGAGNRLTQQDPGGNCSATPKTGCTTLTYDLANQLKTITYSDGVTPNVTNISYDGDGQRSGMADGTGTSAWVWDSLHRLTSYTNGAGAQVQYAYNLRNLPATVTYPGSLNVTRGYDNAGRLTSVQDWLSNTTAFGYDVNSNLTTETLPTASGVVDSFSFDAADRHLGQGGEDDPVCGHLHSRQRQPADLGLVDPLEHGFLPVQHAKPAVLCGLLDPERLQLAAPWRHRLCLRRGGQPGPDGEHPAGLQQCGRALLDGSQLRRLRLAAHRCYDLYVRHSRQPDEGHAGDRRRHHIGIRSGQSSDRLRDQCHLRL
jgi:YD repeat-containing protein